MLVCSDIMGETGRILLLCTAFIVVDFMQIDTYEKPLACWMGKEEYMGRVLHCLTVIFRSGGCSWNRCTMCGYRHERYSGLSSQELTRNIKNQISWIKMHYDDSDYQMLKIFTSGSFLDSDEVPEGARRAVAEAFRGHLIIAETRPEYVSSDIVSEFLCAIDDGSWEHPLYVAMGLETTNDHIRQKCIDKGHSFNDFLKAARQAREGGAGIKTYLLMKPPFLTEKEAMEDMQRSIIEAAPFSDILSMNLCTVQNHTEVEYYWKRKAYRPPYLWSVLNVLAGAKIHVQCDPVGGGHLRGPHNCGECDGDIVRGIRSYSLNRDRQLIKSLLEMDCRCKEEWEYVLGNEKPYCMPLTR